MTTIPAESSLIGTTMAFRALTKALIESGVLDPAILKASFAEIERTTRMALQHYEYEAGDKALHEAALGVMKIFAGVAEPLPPGSGPTIKIVR
jgi:hypothetical protein